MATESNDLGFSLNDLDTILSEIETLATLEKITGVRRRFLTVGVLAALLFITTSVITFGVMCNLLCCLYPIYASMQALEDDTDTREWLSTWIVLVLFMGVTGILEPVFVWVPFYHMFKTSFMIYVFYPKTKGGVFLYQNWIRPASIPFLKMCSKALDKDAMETVKNIIESNADKRSTKLD